MSGSASQECKRPSIHSIRRRKEFMSLRDASPHPAIRELPSLISALLRLTPSKLPPQPIYNHQYPSLNHPYHPPVTSHYVRPPKRILPPPLPTRQPTLLLQRQYLTQRRIPTPRTPRSRRNARPARAVPAARSAPRQRSRSADAHRRPS